MAVSPIPAAHHTITPYMVVRDAAKAIEFYKKAFGAIEIHRMLGPDGKGVMHAEMKIGDSVFYLTSEWPGAYMASPEKFGGTTVAIHVYVPNVDAFMQQAVAAGAKVSMPLMDMFWGDRFGKVIDPFGHEWSLATHIEDVPHDEMERRGVEAMKQMGTK